MIVSTAEPPRPRTTPTTILAVLEEWGCTWMWNSIWLIGNYHWLEDATEAGACVTVTDGSCVLCSICSRMQQRKRPNNGIFPRTIKQCQRLPCRTTRTDGNTSDITCCQPSETRLDRDSEGGVGLPGSTGQSVHAARKPDTQSVSTLEHY